MKKLLLLIMFCIVQVSVKAAQQGLLLDEYDCQNYASPFSSSSSSGGLSGNASEASPIKIEYEPFQQAILQFHLNRFPQSKQKKNEQSKDLVSLDAQAVFLINYKLQQSELKKIFTQLKAVKEKKFFQNMELCYGKKDFGNTYILRFLNTTFRSFVVAEPKLQNIKKELDLIEFKLSGIKAIIESPFAKKQVDFASMESGYEVALQELMDKKSVCMQIEADFVFWGSQVFRK